MRVYRWDIYFKGRYVFHVYFTEDVEHERAVLEHLRFEEINGEGSVQDFLDAGWNAYLRKVEKDK